MTISRSDAVSREGEPSPLLIARWGRQTLGFAQRFGRSWLQWVTGSDKVLIAHIAVLLLIGMSL